MLPEQMVPMSSPSPLATNKQLRSYISSEAEGMRSLNPKSIAEATRHPPLVIRPPLVIPSVAEGSAVPRTLRGNVSRERRVVQRITVLLLRPATTPHRAVLRAGTHTARLAVFRLP